MGQGGFITIVNGTAYDWHKTYEHAYQMNAWNLPQTIAAGMSISVYVEWDQHIFTTASDDAGESTYTLAGAPYSFQIQARASSGFNLQVQLVNISSVVNPEGSTLPLGWVHDGYVQLVVTGAPGSFVFNQPPTSWMQASLAQLGGRTLRELCIPGSHDSGMSTLTSGTAFVSESNVLTQTHDVLGQLNLGVRYFDIRPVISGGQYSTGHYSQVGSGNLSTWQGANGQSLRSIVQQVNAFLANHQELVVLYLSHDLNTDLGNQSYASLTQANWNDLLSQLTELNHRYVASSGSAVDLTRLTLNDFIGQNRAAVVIVVDPSGGGISLGQYAGQGFYQPSSFSVFNQYADTNTLNAMMSDQLQKMAAQRPNPEASYFLLSWTLTQGNWQAISGSSSIMELAAQANPMLYDKLLPACTASCYPNILYIDDVTTPALAALALAVCSKATAH